MKKTSLHAWLNGIFWLLFIVGSVYLLAGSYTRVLPFSFIEDLGFITGALCVWWTVEENVWNWPASIANSIFFIFLFLSSGIYANVWLQVVYIVLSVLGWYWWLKGGKGKTELPVSKVKKNQYVYYAIFVITATLLMNIYLHSIRDSAPFWDALTTALSLAALYMQTRKYIESWYIWITANVIYIILFYYQHLYLTSILYILFLLMCLEGQRQWRKTYSSYKMRPGTGLVIGKFYPFHHGHSFLIQTALTKVKNVTVIVCERKGETIPGALRARWIKANHSGVDTKIIEDIYPQDDSAIWAKKTIEWLGFAPEYVFTSEQYGAAYAKLMGSTHIPVDMKRTLYPVSGTMVRKNPKKYFPFLSPIVRNYYENNLRSGS
jgi:nicotinamide mononucleotide transporter